MPAIADPYGARAFDATSDSFRRPAFEGTPRSLRLRVRTAHLRTELTRALAEGADPRASHELSLRAAQLTRDRSRRALARSLRRTVAEAHRPAIRRSRVVFINRAAVLDAEGAIETMVDRLGNSKPVSAEGMAIAARILTDADGPLYNASEPGTLRRAIGVATVASEPARSQSHEFPIAA
jgi:hypothetical protein